MEPSSTPDAPDAAPLEFRGLRLFPFQRRAVEAIFAGRSVVVAAPTGAGKTLVADYAVDRAFAAGRRVVYTSPIKALSNQKFRDFRASYGEERVGIMTGDVTLQPDAPLLVMTTEIFRNTVFEDPARLEGFDFAIFDEVHYLDDRERGTVWEESILFAPPHIRVVALSATVPNVEELAAWMASVRGSEVDVIVETERPVPLVHRVWIPGRGPRSLPDVRAYFVEKGRHERSERDHRRGRGARGPRRSRHAQEAILDDAGEKMLDHLQERDLLPAIVFSFRRADCERLARGSARRHLLRGREQERLVELFDDLAERYEVRTAPDTQDLRELAADGVLFHHAGMLPIDKEIVERLFTTGGVKLLFATETFSLGVNMPARTVVFHALTKFDGVAHTRLLAREYWQMAGRAGRQGIDEKGYVYALLDDTRVDAVDLERLQSGRIEPVRSRFNLSYSGILSLYRRAGERVVDAYERSFARFQRGEKKKEGPRSGGAQIRARLAVLEEHHYLADGALTRKGALCSQVNGYEIAVTEAVERGLVERGDPVQLVLLFAAMVYEPRRHDESAPPRRSLRGIAVPFTTHMEAFAASEAARGVEWTTKAPDFGVAGPVEAWADGNDFDAALAKTSLAAGDLVRLLRMTIQLLRQAEHALAHDDPSRIALRAARDRIDRDLVDARRQLELG